MHKSVLIADFNSGGQALADGHVYTGGLQIWTDNNGNGAFDPGEWVSSEDAHAAGNSNVWMDAGGNLWFGRTTDDRGRLGAVVKLPLAGWSRVGSTDMWNPVYRWNDPKYGHKVVVPAAVPEGAFAPHFLQIGADGKIYQIGNTPTHGGYCNGLAGLRISNSSGSVLSTFLMPDRSGSSEGSLNGFSPNPVGATGFFFTDSIDFLDNAGQRVNVWTEDGLKIARALPGAPAGYSAGWPEPEHESGGLHFTRRRRGHAARLCRGRCSQQGHPIHVPRPGDRRTNRQTLPLARDVRPAGAGPDGHDHRQ